MDEVLPMSDAADALDSPHPALAGREKQMSALASSVRRLIDMTVTNDAAPEVLEKVLVHLDSATNLLSSHMPAEPHPRFVVPGSPPRRGSPGQDEGDMQAAMPFDPVVGRFNPLALPISITFEPPRAIGTACFTAPYQGAPGWVHGAAIASAFDIVLTAANRLVGPAGPTVWLTVRFKRPTLLDVQTRLEAEVVSNGDRRVTSRGTLLQRGKVCVEAEGEFAVIDPGRLTRSSYRPSP